MNVITIILCAVSITASIFLIARFGIKKQETAEFVADERIVEDVNIKVK